MNSSRISSLKSSLPLWFVEISGYANNCTNYFLIEISIIDFLHFFKDHWKNFLRKKLLSFTMEVNFNDGFTSNTWFKFEGPVFYLILDRNFIEFSSNESLYGKYSVFCISSWLIKGSVSNHCLFFCEGNIWRSRTYAYIVRNYLN